MKMYWGDHPYRAQITVIRQELDQAEMHKPLITIDTVERYQGGHVILF